jgi:hypothetical protein
MLAPTGQTLGGIGDLFHGNKCPTVFHSDGTTNFNLSAFLGVFSRVPMASPPIYASSTDARNDRGARPLHTGKLEALFIKTRMRQIQIKIRIKNKTKQTGAVFRGGRLERKWWGSC